MFCHVPCRPMPCLTHDGAAHDSYSVIDMRFVERYDELVLRVRNPWGKGEWTGRFSDLDISKDPEMAKVMMEEFSTVSLEEGGVTDAEPYVRSPPWLCVRGGVVAPQHTMVRRTCFGVHCLWLL